MPINGKDLARIVDATNIKITATKADMERLIAEGIKHNFGMLVGLPCFGPMLIEGVKGYDIKVHGAAGLRDGGGDRWEVKVEQAKSKLAMGCGEIESRLNLGYLKSGLYDEIVHEVRAIKDVCPNNIYKVLMEVTQMTDEEIRIACELCMDGGADFVKSASGEYGPTTLHHVEVMSSAVKGRIGMKASGGIRSIQTVDQMMEIGATRFGIGLDSALKILEEADNR